MRTLGLDIGGAAIKLADGRGWAEYLPFPLWRRRDELAAKLRTIALRHSPERVALTMTGELCDCFQTKQEGVEHILDSARSAFDPAVPIAVWQTTGAFASLEEAARWSWSTAAANWLALATFAGLHVRRGRALAIDVGSTTTDIIPLEDGRPTPIGRTDPERLASGELVYVGVERTPICALAPTAMVRGVAHRTMAELFATSLDAYLVLGHLPEDPDQTNTADGRPATVPFAIDRLARIVGSDRTRFTHGDAVDLARQIDERIVERMADGVNQVGRTVGAERWDDVIASGEGEFLLGRLVERTRSLHGAPVIRLAQELGPAVSRAVCAHAVATLLEGDQPK